jgi:hypothetical protein
MAVRALKAESNVTQEDPADRDPRRQIKPDDFVRLLDEPLHPPDVCALDDPLVRRAGRELASVNVVMADADVGG